MTLPINAVVDQGELQVSMSNAAVLAVVEPKPPVPALRPPLEHDSRPLPPELLALFDRLAELGRVMRNPGPSNGAAVDETGKGADISSCEASLSDAISVTETADAKVP